MSECEGIRGQLGICRQIMAKTIVEMNEPTVVDQQSFDNFSQLKTVYIEQNILNLKKLIRELDYKWSLYLNDVTDHTQLQERNGFIFPRSVGGDLHLRSLTCAEGLVLPELIGSTLDLGELKNAEGLMLPKEVGYGLNLYSLRNATGLVLPEKVGGELNLLQLENANGIVMPKEVGFDLKLRGLRTAEGLVLPKKVGESLWLDSLDDVKGLTLPEEVGETVIIRKHIYEKLASVLTPEDLQKYKFKTTY